MSSPYQSRFGAIGRDPVNLVVQDNLDEVPGDIHHHGGMKLNPSVVPSEPVTPPASANPTSIYSAKPAFSTYQPSVGKAAAHAFASGGLQTYSYGSGPLASPLETPTAAPYTPQQPYIAKSNAPSAVNAPGTPMQSAMLSSSRYGYLPGAGTPAAAAPGTAGHNRSYSYSPADVQPTLKRMSLSGNSTSTSSSTNSLRPRAYSSSGASATPFTGPAQHSAQMETAFSYPFPAPLSSPVSPGANGQTGAHISQRPYSQVFMRTLSEDQLSTGPLRRTLSSVSASGGLNESMEESHVGSGGVTSIRRNSPPHYGRYYHPRRSSSSASSIELAAGAPTNIGTGLGAGAPTAGSPPGGSANIDIAAASDAQIYALCKDQRGCRFLQRKLSEHDPLVVRRIFDSTYPHMITLMMDPFGNYFCQKLFDHCNPNEITMLLRVAAPSLPSVAVNQHGTRALQKLVDAVTLQEQVDIIVQALDGNVVRLIRDLNGNHVVQKLLLNLDESGTQFIYDAMCDAVVDVGSHRHGCCVLQRCLDHAQDYNRHRLVAHIVAQSLALVCDPFGNYVCQYVIDLGIPEYTNSLVEQFLGKIALLSVQKFSSNVVEKCLRSASPPLQRALVMEIMVPRTLHELLLDNYGNYVIQTALESTGATDPAMKQQLAASVQTALTTTRSPYGRRIMSKLKT